MSARPTTRQVVVPDHLGERIDAARGDIPFSMWMRRAAEEKLASATRQKLTWVAGYLGGLGAPVFMGEDEEEA